MSISFQYRSRVLTIVISGILLILTVLASISIGIYSVPLHAVFEVIKFHFFGGPAINNVYETIVWDIRIPRILMGAIIGMALAISGATYQGIFRNPLVSPFILGISSGAAFGASLAIMFPVPFSAQISAFIFGMIAVFAAYSLARVRGRTPLVTLLLAGVILGSFFDAMVAIFQYLAAEYQLKAIVFWLMGGLYRIEWNDLINLGFLIPFGIILLILHAWKLNVLSMGDEEARALGINVERLKLALITVATFITSLSVSISGIIGWVGLMIPHASRLIIGPDHRFLLPLSAIMGAIFLIICDTIARTITTGEVPLGIVTSVLGAPYLIYLIRSKKTSFFGGD